MHQNKHSLSKKIKEFVHLPTGTIVSFTYKPSKGKKSLNRFRRIYKVEIDYGFHVLFTDILNKDKLNISKDDCITYGIEIVELNG